MKYSMICSCGDEVTVEANNQDEAIQKMQAMMSEAALKAHFAQKHPGEEVLNKAMSDQLIEQNIQPA